MALLARRVPGSRRRALADINVVPYIDVMLVLVVILMVSAPFVNPSLVDLPSFGGGRVPETRFEIVIKADGQVLLFEGGKQLGNDLIGAVAIVKKRQETQPELKQKTPVLISADKNLRYEQVMKVMSALQKENIARVGLAVQPERK
jgi:biopolymer transport protein TolR